MFVCILILDLKFFFALIHLILHSECVYCDTESSFLLMNMSFENCELDHHSDCIATYELFMVDL